jgi:hypothetical protein
VVLFSLACSSCSYSSYSYSSYSYSIYSCSGCSCSGYPCFWYSYILIPVLDIPVLDVPVLIGQVNAASSKLRCAIKRRISGCGQLCDWHLRGADFRLLETRQDAAKCRQGLDLSPGSVDPAFDALMGSSMALANALSHKGLTSLATKVRVFKGVR